MDLRLGHSVAPYRRSRMRHLPVGYNGPKQVRGNTDFTCPEFFPAALFFGPFCYVTALSPRHEMIVGSLRDNFNCLVKLLRQSLRPPYPVKIDLLCCVM